MNTLKLKIKKLFLVILAAMTLISSLPPRAFAGRGFSDDGQIPSWAHSSVLALTEQKILNGYPDGRFAPNDPVTFEQVIVGTFNVFWLQDQAKQLAETMPPLDNVSSWAQGYVRLALQNNLLREYGNYSPINKPDQYSAPAPRAWVAGFLSYALGYGQWSWHVANRVPFSDLGKIPADLRMMVHTAVDLGIAAGMGNDSFEPGMTISRAQYAVMLQNAKKVIETKGSVRTYYPSVPPQQTVQPVGMGFFQRGQGKSGKEIDRRMLKDLSEKNSHIQFLNMMSYAMKADGRVFNVDKTWGDRLFESTVDIAHKNGVKTLLVLQNHSLSRFEPDFAHRLLSDTGLQQKLIEWLVEEIKTNGDSGVNIDFENLYNADRDLFTQFVARVYQEMKKRGWITVVSVLPKTNDIVDFLYYDYDKLGQYADYVFLMTYDESNAYGAKQGPNYTVPFVEKNLKFSLTSVPRNKLLLGVGSHSWVWNDAKVKQFTTWEVDQMIAGGSAKAHRDSGNAAYATYYDAAGNLSTVYHQDFDSYKTEFQLLKKYNLGGYVLFPLGWENDSLWEALILRVKN
ncbi:MAG: hypothetical protein VR68_15120 [Peptococcaceae bacterium BRH_c4a]|nr:MAG: hypothetical protein VR68_15120 [Peptococcaceae bacterium BRH_c4a]